MHSNEHKEHTMNNIGVVKRIFPKPVSGDTIPPKRNVRKPNSADALPELLLSKSSAIAVELGNISPKNTRYTNSETSINHTDVAVIKIIPTNKLIAQNPLTPNLNALSASRKRDTARLPIIIPKAFTPKHRLYASGDAPKCSWKIKGDAAI